MYYYYHPESDSVWSQKEPEEYSDGLTEEIDRERYLQLIKELDQKG